MSTQNDVLRKRCLVSIFNQKKSNSKDQDGMTLVEVVVAILIFLIIMLGGMNYFILPQSNIIKEKKKRLAIFAAHQKLEELTAKSYDELTVALNEKGKSIKIGSYAAKRKTTIAYIDDAADGKGFKDKDKNIVDYKYITVEIYSYDQNNNSISLSTIVSKYGK